MPRLRDIQTGAVVSVSDETAARLGHGWEPADKQAPEAAAPARRPAKRAVRRPVKRTVAKKAAASKTEK